MSMGKMAIATQFQIFLRLVWSPEAAFREIGGTGPFLVPLLLLSMVGIIVQLINLPFVEHVALNNMPAGMDQEQLQKGMHLLRLSQLIGMVASPIYHLLRWFCISGLIFLVLQLAGGAMSYRQCFSLVAFSSIFLGLESCLATVILSLRGIDKIRSPLDLSPPLGLNLLLPRSGGAFYSFLNNFNLFEMWYLAVLILGIAYFNHFSKKKAALVVTPVWLFLVGTQVALIALGSSLQSKG